MRASAYITIAIGLGTLGWGGYTAYQAATDDSSISATGSWIMAGSLLLFGLVILLTVPRRLLNAAPARVRNGVAGYGTVQSVRDTGITVNGTQMVTQLEILAEAPGIPAFPARASVKLGRTQWGAIQPGMRVPVLIDPSDHSKVAFDYDRSVEAGPGAAFGGAAVGAGGPQAVVRSAADLIANGVPVMGTLFSAQPAGVTAGSVSPGLPSDQADDPLVAVSFGYPGPDGQMRTMNALVRVPDGKLLSANAPVPVCYLPDQPDTATIDWSRL